MKTVTYSDEARRQMRGLPRDVQADIRADVAAYAAGEPGFAADRLQGVDVRRLRVGAYRVLLNETADRIRIVRVGHRDGFYDRMRPRR